MLKFHGPWHWIMCFGSALSIAVRYRSQAWHCLCQVEFNCKQKRLSSNSSALQLLQWRSHCSVSCNLSCNYVTLFGCAPFAKMCIPLGGQFESFVSWLTSVAQSEYLVPKLCLQSNTAVFNHAVVTSQHLHHHQQRRCVQSIWMVNASQEHRIIIPVAPYKGGGGRRRRTLSSGRGKEEVEGLLTAWTSLRRPQPDQAGHRWPGRGWGC